MFLVILHTHTYIYINIDLYINRENHPQRKTIQHHHPRTHLDSFFSHNPPKLLMKSTVLMMKLLTMRSVFLLAMGAMFVRWSDSCSICSFWAETEAGVEEGAGWEEEGAALGAAGADGAAGAGGADGGGGAGGGGGMLAVSSLNSPIFQSKRDDTVDFYRQRGSREISICVAWVCNVSGRAMWMF
jgi:hypothetical protein